MHDGEQQISFMHVPPFIDKHFADKFGMPTGQRLNLSSTVLNKDDKQELTLSFEGEISMLRHLENM